VDCGWPEHQVLIEWDSRKHHLVEAQFEHDRRRDDTAIAHGWAPLRFTWKMVHGDPFWVVVTTVTTLCSRGLALPARGRRRPQCGAPNRTTSGAMRRVQPGAGHGQAGSLD